MDWRNEARICREDGHPHAALAAMAYALLGEHAGDPIRHLREFYPRAWDELDHYREILGLPDWPGTGLSWVHDHPPGVARDADTGSPGAEAPWAEG